MYNYVMHILLFDIFHNCQNRLMHLILAIHKHNKRGRNLNSVPKQLSLYYG